MKLFRVIINWVRGSIFRKLTAAFLLLIIVPVLIISFISFKLSEDIILDKVGASAAKTLEQSALSVNHIMDNMIYASNSVNLNEAVKSTLNKQPAEDWIQLWSDYQAINNVFTTLNSTFIPYVSYYTILGKNGQIFTSWTRSETINEQLSQKLWYKDLLKNEFLWIPIHENYVLEPYDKGPLLTLSRFIYEDIGMNTYGQFMISIPHSTFLNVLRKAKTSTDSMVMILDDQNMPIIVSELDSVAYEQLGGIETMQMSNGSYVSSKGNQQYLINYHRLKRNGWKVIEIIPYESLLGEIVVLRERITLFLVLFVVLFIVLSTLVALSITNPIRKLYASIHRVKKGDLSVQLSVNSRDEVGLLINHFNDMVIQVQELIDRLYEQQENQRKLEIKALQSQIEPHFLFNTLNSIRWVAVMSEAGNVSDMIGSLSHLLKMSISTDERYITIEQELENVKHYVLIQKVRYHMRFDVFYEFEPELLDSQIIKLIMQPIVENAILHGMDKKGSGSRILIAGRRTAENILIEISDNGIGMDELQLARLREKVYSGASSRGIGLSNVNQRLVLSYGEAYRLTIHSVENKGTSVIIRIPSSRFIMARQQTKKEEK